MNTPTQCLECPHVYSNVLTEDDPQSQAECWLGNAMEGYCKYHGKDNYKHPKSEYLTKLHDMDDEELFKAMKDRIWLSAYASNNPRSDYHWQCDATYDEGRRRGKPELYGKAHKEVSQG